MKNKGFKLRMGLTIGVLLVIYYFVAGTISLILDPIVPGKGNIAFGVATLLTIGITAVQYYIGKKMTLELVGAEPLSQDQYPEIHTQAVELADSMDVPIPQLMIAELGGPNAFAIGRKNDGVIVLSKQLLDLLDTKEIAGVLGHELAHLQNHDVVVMSICNTIIWLAIIITKFFAIVSVMGIAFATELVAGALTRGRKQLAVNWGKVQTIVATSAATIVLLFITIFERALSRHREYVADAQSAKHIGDIDGMISSLQTVEQASDSAPKSQAGELSALCIFGESKNTVSKLFADHPPIEDRIEALQSLEPIQTPEEAKTPK